MDKPVTVTMGDKALYKGAAKAPVIVKIRDGEPYKPAQTKLLWEEIQEIRKKANGGK